MKGIFLAVCLLSSVASMAQEGNVIPFQGQLANQAGQPLLPTSPSTLVFRLYRQAVGGIALWEESQPNISVNAGRFSVLLGSRTELPAAPNFNATLYLGITVDDGNPATADVEMRPRQALVPVMSANSAKNANKLNGFDWIPVFGVNDPTGPIPASKLAEGSLPASKLLPLSIGSNQIAAGGVSGDRIAPGTITQREIASGSLTLGLLAEDVLDRLVPPGGIAIHQVFTNSGEWIAPSNLLAPLVVVYGCGGGGGGGSGGGLIPGAPFGTAGGGGSGGGGAFPAMRIVPVTPGITYSVTAGAAGVGAPRNTSSTGAVFPGGDGGAATFGSVVVSLGGGGGGGGASVSGGSPAEPRPHGVSGGSGGSNLGVAGSKGGRNMFADGGLGGVFVSCQGCSGGGGGGGAAGLGAGGNGGNTSSGSGVSAAPNSGAGGGGGGGGNQPSRDGGLGGNGGSGFLEVIWFAPQ